MREQELINNQWQSFIFLEGDVRVLLGLQLSGGSRGSDEEENRSPGSPESSEPGGLQHQRREPRLQRRIHLQILQLRHPQPRRGLREVLPLRTPGKELTVKVVILRIIVLKYCFTVLCFFLVFFYILHLLSLLAKSTRHQENF